MTKEPDSTSRSVKRDEMIKYAFDLFYKNGFHATGVDTIMEAPVFPSVRCTSILHQKRV
jgi:AcrR family transcriptional regulator